MIEWTKLLRSIRYETDTKVCDVWPVIERDGKWFRFSVFDNQRKQYTACGIEREQDVACEKALREAGT